MQAAQNRLRITLLLFTVCLALPIAALLWMAYSQLKFEAAYALSVQAQALATSIEQKLVEILRTENARPFDEYNFLSVSTNPLSQTKNLSYSPLAQFPPKSSVPGVLAYFQIDPNGKLSSPLLPNDGRTDLTLGSDEFRKRKSVVDALEKSLSRIDSEEGTRGAPAYFDEARQLGTVGNMPRSVVTPQKLNEDFYRQTQKGASPDYKSRGLSDSAAAPQERRKEQVSLAEDPVIAPSAAGAPVAELDAGAKQEIAGQVARITTFESEIDPLRFKVLNPDQFLFTRRAFRNNHRFTQGFLVEKKGFLEELVGKALQQSSFSNYGRVVVFRDDTLLFESSNRIVEVNSAAPILLYRTRMPFPLESLELNFAVDTLEVGYRLWFVYLLALSIFIVLLLGALIIYRLGRKEIALAQKKNDFVSAVSHELKTPLTSIRMYAEMLRSGWVKDEDKFKEYYDFIFHESERLSRLINNVLTLARVSKNEKSTESEAHTPQALLDLIRSKVAQLIEGAGFTLAVKTPADDTVGEIIVDSDLFCQVMINLVENALKFSRESADKRIEIGYVHDGRLVTFYVRDFGPGIEHKNLTKIFDLFFRVENELTRKTAGTGIGLALVKELVEKMGGTVQAVNREPGAEFRVSF